MQSFKQYLIEARYAGDHPLVARIRVAMADGKSDAIKVGDYKVDEIQQALISGFGKPDNNREPTKHELGELFWDVNGYDIYYLYPDLHSDDPRDPEQFSNVFVDNQREAHTEYLAQSRRRA